MSENEWLKQLQYQFAEVSERLRRNGVELPTEKECQQILDMPVNEFFEEIDSFVRWVDEQERDTE